MKLAIAQIILGVFVLILDGLAIGGVLSTHFSYLQPHGESIDVIKPESLRVARWATIAVVPFGLAVVGCGIAALRKARVNNK